MTPSKLSSALKEIEKVYKKAQNRVKIASESGGDISSALQILRIFEGIMKVHKGEKGDKGDMPVKGVDYFTPTEVKFFLKAATPIKGVHYRDGVDGKSIRGEDGKDGRDGVDGIANMEEVKMEVMDRTSMAIESHEERHDHKLIHDPKMLGKYELGEVHEADFLQVRGNKIVGTKIPKAQPIRGGVSSTNRARFRVRDVTASETIDPLDDVLHVDASGGSITLTIYSASGQEGSQHYIKRVDNTLSNDVTFQMTGSETIDFATLHKLVNQGSGAKIYAHSGNWYVMHY